MKAPAKSVEQATKQIKIKPSTHPLLLELALEKTRRTGKRTTHADIIDDLARSALKK